MENLSEEEILLKKYIDEIATHLYILNFQFPKEYSLDDFKNDNKQILFIYKNDEEIEKAYNENLEFRRYCREKSVEDLNSSLATLKKLYKDCLNSDDRFRQAHYINGTPETNYETFKEFLKKRSHAVNIEINEQADQVDEKHLRYLDCTGKAVKLAEDKLLEVQKELSGKGKE